MAETASETRNEERLFTGYSGRLSLAAAAGWMAVLLGRDALPPLLPAIVDDLAITPSEAGLGLTLLFAVYSVAHVPGGRFSDRLSRRTLLVGSLGVVLVGFAALTLTRSYPVFLVALLLVGAGAGAYLPTTRGLLSDLFVTRRGQAFGIQMSAGSIGSTAAAGLAVAALSLATWQATFLPVVLLLGLSMVAIHVWSREPYVLDRVTLGLRDTGARLLGDGEVRLLLVAYSLFSIPWVGILGFLPTFLQAEKGVSPVLASAAFAGFYVVGTVVTPLAGRVSDRFPSLPFAAASLLVSVAGLVLMTVAPTLALVGVGLFVYAVGARSFPPTVQSYVLGVFPEGNRAGDFGAMKSVYTLVGSVGPTYVGLVAERWSYATAFAGFVPLLAGSLLVLAWMVVTD